LALIGRLHPLLVHFPIFSIPKLKIDMQVPKGGESVTVEFTAPAAGRYEIACSEFCGSGHRQMKAALISVGPTQTSR
jgi:heme/copper-type cytochrome/quinol oxidase subunit 2